jgi:hypothetical protein
MVLLSLLVESNDILYHEMQIGWLGLLKAYFHIAVPLALFELPTIFVIFKNKGCRCDPPAVQVTD